MISFEAEPRFVVSHPLFFTFLSPLHSFQSRARDSTSCFVCWLVGRLVGHSFTFQLHSTRLPTPICPSVLGWSVCRLTRLYNKLCPSVYLSVRPSIRHAFTFLAFRGFWPCCSCSFLVFFFFSFFFSSSSSSSSSSSLFFFSPFGQRPRRGR